MRIEHFKVSNFSVSEVVKLINSCTEGRSVHGVFFNKESFLNGTLEIYTTDIRTHVVEVEKTVKKESKKSKYRGVSWDKSLNKWRARIMVNGKRISLGVYDDAKEAAKVYDLAAMRSLGDKAKLNFKLSEHIWDMFEEMEKENE